MNRVIVSIIQEKKEFKKKETNKKYMREMDSIITYTQNLLNILNVIAL